MLLSYYLTQKPPSHTSLSVLKAFIEIIIFTYDSYTFYTFYTSFSSQWYSSAGAAEQTTINPRLIYITPIASRAEEEDFAWFQESMQLLVSPNKPTDLAILAMTFILMIVLDDATTSTPLLCQTSLRSSSQKAL